MQDDICSWSGGSGRPLNQKYIVEFNDDIIVTYWLCVERDPKAVVHFGIGLSGFKRVVGFLVCMSSIKSPMTFKIAIESGRMFYDKAGVRSVRSHYHCQ